MLNSCKKVLEILNNNGYEAYMVGGFVRDYILNIPYNDIDITTNALPEEVMKLFDKAIPTGIKYGTVLVIYNGFRFEITTYRIDGEYNDSRHPDEVVFSKSLEQDLKRRDFTINAFAMDKDMNLTDLFEGKLDLSNKIIRAIGNPKDRFNEDALRILRAFHFKSKLGFEIEDKTYYAIIELQNKLKNVSIERIQMELNKITSGMHKDNALARLNSLNVMKEYFKLCLSYKIDDLLDLYIISFYINKGIPNIYHLSKDEKRSIEICINLLNSIKEYDIYNHYLYRKLYERAIKLYNRINNKDIICGCKKFIIDSIKELDIKSRDLSKINIDNRFHSTILKDLEKRVVEGKISNTKNILEKEAKMIYNSL